MKTSKNKQSQYYILGILMLAILAILIIPNIIVSTIENVASISGTKLPSKAQKQPIEIKMPGSVARKWM